MKKYIAVLLCFALVLSMFNPMGVYAVSPLDVNGTLVEAQRAPAGVDVESPITEESWGKPTISIDKNSANAAKWMHNVSSMEDLEMDIYFRWDQEYLYIGVVSPDSDVRGAVKAWEGDGIQFKICSGLTMSSSAKNLYFSLGADGVSITAGGGSEGYAHNVVVVDDVMHATIAVPFADLGMVADDVKAGAPLSFSMIRINGNADHEYAGWLAWGALFGVGNAYNEGCTGDNVIVLSNELADVDTVIKSNKAYQAPALDNINKNTWGKPAIRVDKNSYNTTLFSYLATAEDNWADIYTVWDDEYIYIGVVSPDTDVNGHADGWEGDGIQFKLSAGENMASDALNFYMTFGADDVSITAGDTANKSDAYPKSIKMVNGEMHAAVAIPFADLGMLAEDIKNGAALTISLLRISGTTDSTYAGWLAWGTMFGAGHDYNVDCVMDNAIVLSDDTAETATVVVADKAPGVIDVAEGITPDVWGIPTIRIDKNSYNATLFSYQATAEDTWMDIYTTWDKDYLYIGVVSPDADVNGHADGWEGDGIQFKLSAGKTMASDALNFYMTFGADDVSITVGDTANKSGDYAKSIKMIGGEMHAAVAIPFADLGMLAEDVKAGAPLSFSLIRISGTSDHTYAGWLAWGAMFGANHDYNTNCSVDNVIVLGDDKAQTTAVEANRIFGKPDATGIVDENVWGKPTISINKDSFNAALYSHNAPAEDTNMDIYFRWDNDYLYIGVVSPDFYARGSEKSWEGDGIQFKLCAGNVMSASAMNLHFSLDANGIAVSAGGGSENYSHNVAIIGGMMHATIAVPFADLGLAAADVKAGAKFSFSMLRISGTADHEYAGWLAWGAMFGANHTYTPGCAYDNVIVLSNTVEMNATTITADKAMTVPALDNINKDTWGSPAIRIDKDSYNAVLKNYLHTAEDAWADIYTAWDDEYIYIGVVSPDADVNGHADGWEGDGIQFKLAAGEEMTATALNFYMTFGADGISITAGDTANKSGEYAKSIKTVNGEMHAAVAVPFADLGMLAADIKAGAPLSFSILRISGTSNSTYAGWLAWGAFFGADSDNNPGCYVDNVIVLSDDIADQATVIESEKAYGSVDVNDITTFGDAVIRVDKDSYNADLHDHDHVAEDTWMDVYTTWDGEYIYIGVASPDSNVRGHENSWEGDGIQFKISAGKKMAADALNLYFTFGDDGVSITAGGGSEDYAHNLVVVDGVMYATIAVPFADLGMLPEDIEAGAPLSFSILRISGTSDHQYAGWLAWGAFFGANSANHPACKVDNVIVLADSGAEIVEEEEDVFQSLLLNIPKSASGAMADAGTEFVYGDGFAHKQLKLDSGIYTIYLTRSGIMAMPDGSNMINEFTIQKIVNGEAKEVAYNYTYEGLQDVVTDGTYIYVIGGNTTHTFDRYLNTDSAERAVINVWRFDPATNAMNGYKVYKDFGLEASGYEFLGATADMDAGKLYISYVGLADDVVGSIEMFVFDLETMNVSNSYAFELEYSAEGANLANGSFVVTEDGVCVIYSDDNAGIFIADEEGTVSEIGEGELIDVVVTADGDIVLAYADGQGIVNFAVYGEEGLGEALIAELRIESFAVRFAQSEDGLYIIAVNKEGAVCATIVSVEIVDGEVVPVAGYGIQLDMSIEYESSLMAITSYNGSALDGNIEIMFAGYRGSTLSWYSATIPLDSLDEF